MQTPARIKSRVEEACYLAKRQSSQPGKQPVCPRTEELFSARLGARQRQGERGAATGSGRVVDRAAVRKRNGRGDREAESGTTCVAGTAGVRAVKAVEDVINVTRF